MKRTRSAAASSSASAPLAGPRGYRQKMAIAAKTGEMQNSSESFLATYLIDQWAWGALSTPTIQKIAMATKKDFEAAGIPTPGPIESIASIGSYGDRPEHTYRDLTQYKLKHPSLSAAVSPIKLWVKKSHLRSEECPQQIILPHELFAHLYLHDQEEFSNRMFGSNKRNIEKFWRQMEAGSELYARHPVRRREDHKSMCIHIGMHGDWVTCTGVGRAWSKGGDTFRGRAY